MNRCIIYVYLGLRYKLIKSIYRKYDRNKNTTNKRTIDIVGFFSHLIDNGLIKVKDKS